MKVKNAPPETGLQTLPLQPGQRAIMIVAHPDDEVIWGGGLIMSYPELEWTVVSLCRQGDKDRAPKFLRVSQELGVNGKIFDLDDEDKLSDDQSIAEAKKILENYFQNKQFDLLISHGENGEYGHRLHKHVHQVVLELLLERKIKAKKTLFFDYKKIDRKILPIIPADNPDFLLEIKPQVYEKKRQIVAEMYGYPYDGVDVNLCTNVEAFKEFK